MFLTGYLMLECLQLFLYLQISLHIYTRLLLLLNGKSTNTQLRLEHTHEIFISFTPTLNAFKKFNSHQTEILFLFSFEYFKEEEGKWYILLFYCDGLHIMWMRENQQN